MKKKAPGGLSHLVFRSLFNCCFCALFSLFSFAVRSHLNRRVHSISSSSNAFAITQWWFARKNDHIFSLGATCVLARAVNWNCNAWIIAIFISVFDRLMYQPHFCDHQSEVQRARSCLSILFMFIFLWSVLFVPVRLLFILVLIAHWAYYAFVFIVDSGE